jgi:uncharacterized integral membrane protein
MNNRFIYLVEKSFDNTLSGDERIEFNRMLDESPELKKEFEEQLHIKEVLKKMTLKNPTREEWDSYWENTYYRAERGLAWVAISIGAIIFFIIAAYYTVLFFFTDTQTPFIIKAGLGFLIFGFLLLIFSLIREKFFSSKRDKYKEIQR